MFHAPAEAHPLIDQLAQGILFESQAKFDRMQAFLDKKSAKKSEKKSAKESREAEIDMGNSVLPANLPEQRTFPTPWESSAAAAWAQASPTPS